MWNWRYLSHSIGIWNTWLRGLVWFTISYSKPIFTNSNRLSILVANSQLFILLRICSIFQPMEQALPSPSDGRHARSRRCQLALDLNRPRNRLPSPVPALSGRLQRGWCCFVFRFKFVDSLEKTCGIQTKKNMTPTSWPRQVDDQSQSKHPWWQTSADKSVVTFLMQSISCLEVLRHSSYVICSHETSKPELPTTKLDLKSSKKTWLSYEVPKCVSHPRIRTQNVDVQSTNDNLSHDNFGLTYLALQINHASCW